MPGFNKTGPDGRGALTGRGRGMCRKSDDKTFVEDETGGTGSGRARGMGMCRGRGRGLLQGPRFNGNQDVAPASKKDMAE